MKFRYYALWLCFACIVLFVIQIVFSGFTDLFLLNSNSFSEPWRFITAIFLHGDLGHLMYNLFALALFGSILERLVGGNKFLFVFFSTGIAANLVSIFFYDSSLGASGAIFGVIGALIVVRPMMVVWAFGLPMPIFIAGIAWVTGDLLGLLVPSNVANIAHLIGIAFGLVIGLFLRDWRTRKDKTVFTVDEDSVKNWEDNWVR